MVYDITLSEIQSNMDHQQDKFFNMEMALDVKMFHYLNLDFQQDLTLSLDSQEDLTLLRRAERPITPIWTTGRTSYFSSTDLRQDVPLIQHGSLAGRPTSPVRTSGRTSHLSSMDLQQDVPLLLDGPLASPKWTSKRTSRVLQDGPQVPTSPNCSQQDHHHQLPHQLQ